MKVKIVKSTRIHTDGTIVARSAYTGIVTYSQQMKQKKSMEKSATELKARFSK